MFFFWHNVYDDDEDETIPADQGVHIMNARFSSLSPSFIQQPWCHERESEKYKSSSAFSS